MALTLPAALATASPAAANHIAGATYNGTHADGGTVSFALSADGSGVTSFAAGGPIFGNFCTFGGSTSTYVVPLPASSHSFSDTSPPTTISGSFSGPQAAQGTLRVQGGGCDSGQVSWSATTTALPPKGTKKKKCKKKGKKRAAAAKKCKKKKK